jgi:hypothetical protein
VHDDFDSARSLFDSVFLVEGVEVVYLGQCIHLKLDREMRTPARLQKLEVEERCSLELLLRHCQENSKTGSDCLAILCPDCAVVGGRIYPLSVHTSVKVGESHLELVVQVF